MARMLHRLRFAIGLVLLGVLLLPAAGQNAAEKARIVIRLPAAAKLTINGKATTRTGPERTFVTQAIPADEARNYRLVAVWDEGTKSRVAERTVTVRRGARVVVDFNRDEPPEKLTVKPDEKPKQAPPKKPSKVKPKAPNGSEKSKERTFVFSYFVAVTGVTPEQKVRLWIPVAQSNSDQKVEILRSTSPAKSVIDVDPVYGNRIFSTEGPPDKNGRIEVRFDYRVTRDEVKGETSSEIIDDARLLDRYLEADARVPIDGKPLDLLKGKSFPAEPLEVARTLYDVVNNHMRYSKEGTGWGQGDSVWACEHGYGNCSDFHSLFISLARAKKLPAKFEIGFALPEQRGQGDLAAYHCWAKFKPAGSGWIPVDISEASRNPKLKDYYFGNLTPDRITFTTGRDINLVPKQAGPPLNFFVYPYIEVDGKRYTKVETRFAFKDE